MSFDSIATWGKFWTWFYSFTEFFSVVYGPVILVSLLGLLIVSVLLALAFITLDIFGGTIS